MNDFTGCDQLRTDLENRGFTTEKDRLSTRHNQCNWTAYRRTKLPARGHECDQNKSPQIAVRPFIHNKLENAEVDLTGETNGRWYKLLCYSLSPEQLIAQLPEIEAELVAAWNALRE